MNFPVKAGKAYAKFLKRKNIEHLSSLSGIACRSLKNRWIKKRYNEKYYWKENWHDQYLRHHR